MQIGQLEDIVKLCEQAKLTYFKYSNIDEEIIFSKSLESEYQISDGKKETEAISFTHSETETALKMEQAVIIEDLLSIKSDFVGVVALSECVKEKSDGIFVQEGDVLCTIEAMKIYNNVISSISGQVMKVLIEDGEMVECGQELFQIKAEDSHD